MDKIITFNTHDNLGRCFAEAIDIMPRAGGGIEKVAGELDTEIQRYVASLKSDPKYQYVLMTPMGAFEYWGMNVNGDVFPEIALAHCHRDNDPRAVAQELEKKFLLPFNKHLPMMPTKEFGFRTFEDALRYKHHINKDPSIAYGDITFVTYNKAMHRVELVVRHDRERAKRLGAEDIIRDLDEGKPRQISMGCKVPFDVCTICGHVSRTPRDYCIHLKTEMGTVRPDGKIVGAVNFFPRFFDLSDVIVPAAKESGVLMKVASVRGTDNVKVATTKLATMTKNVLPNAISESLMRMSRAEPELPKSLFKSLDLGKLLSTMGMLGMVAKPSEFQYGMLHKMGLPSKAEQLNKSGIVFSPMTSHAPRSHGIGSEDFSSSIANLLKRFIPSRSGFKPHMPERMLRVTVISATPITKIASENDPVLEKIALAYDQYRKSLKTIPKELDKVVNNNFNFYSSNFFDNMLVDHMTKSASVRNINSDVDLCASYFENIYIGTSKNSKWNITIPNLSISKTLL